MKVKALENNLPEKYDRNGLAMFSHQQQEMYAFLSKHILSKEYHSTLFV